MKVSSFMQNLYYLYSKWQSFLFNDKKYLSLNFVSIVPYRCHYTRILFSILNSTYQHAVYNAVHYCHVSPNLVHFCLCFNRKCCQCSLACTENDCFSQKSLGSSRGGRNVGNLNNLLLMDPNSSSHVFATSELLEKGKSLF